MKVDPGRLRFWFVAALWMKAAVAAVEIAAGLATAVASRTLLLRLALALTRDELAEDPRDAIANALLHSARHLSIGAKTFAAAYLLSHGAVKLWLVIGLLREKLWYYPVAIAVFLGFIGYQAYRFTLRSSIPLLALTVLDVCVVVLTWREWRYLRARAAPLSR